MNFNVYKITFINNNEEEQDEIIHAYTSEQARLKIKSNFKNIKITTVLYIPSIDEAKRDYKIL